MNSLSLASTRLFIVLLGLLSAAPVHAAPTLVLSSGTSRVQVVDNGANDDDPDEGAVAYFGAIGVWDFAITVALTKPLSGTSALPDLDLNIYSESSAAGALTIQFSDDTYGTTVGKFTAAVSGIIRPGTGNSVSYGAQISPTNMQFTGTPLFVPLMFSTSGPYAGTPEGSLVAPFHYALTQTLVIAHSGPGVSTADAALVFEEGEGAIGDFVWDDLNENGIQDSGEPGIEGVRLTLSDEVGAPLASTFTNSTGQYQFAGLVAATYLVSVDAASAPISSKLPSPLGAGTPVNDSNATPSTVTLEPSTMSVQSIDFGFYTPATGAIGNFVWQDLNGDGIQDSGEPGIENVTVMLKNSTGVVIRTTTTDRGGIYLFQNLRAGTYTVEVPSSLDVDGNTHHPAVANSGPNRANDSDPVPATVVLSPNSADTTIDFGYKPSPAGQIGNFVWKDVNENGIQEAAEPGIDGVTVRLFTLNDVLLATTVTSSNGEYLFGNLAAGTYKAAVDGSSSALALLMPTNPKQGGDQHFDSNQSPATVTLNNNLDQRLDIDFGYMSVPAGSIGNFVWQDFNGNGIQDATESGIRDVAVQLRRLDNSVISTLLTGSDGIYCFEGLRAGKYVVFIDNSQAALSGYSPSPVTSQGSTHETDSNPNPATVELLYNHSSDRTIDFGYRANGSIGNFIWKDLNSDGVQTVGEPGIAGVTVSLRDSTGTIIATTITSNSGSYVFTALAAGTYKVEVNTAQPALAGCMLTKVNAPGSPTANDSNANPATVLLLTNRSSDQTIDFGFITKPVTYTIGGWGTVPSGSNPGALLKLKFPTLYPTGAVFGGKFTLKFTSQYAIQLFLPQGGTPSKLAASMTNPVVSKGGGVLASQVMGCKLNVDFSNAGILPKGLGAMKFKNGLFSGKTVTQVLALANTALGGGSLQAGATYSDLSDAMALVNENFNDTSNLGNLVP